MSSTRRRVSVAALRGLPRERLARETLWQRQPSSLSRQFVVSCFSALSYSSWRRGANVASVRECGIIRASTRCNCRTCIQSRSWPLQGKAVSLPYNVAKLAACRSDVPRAAYVRSDIYAADHIATRSNYRAASTFCDASRAVTSSSLAAKSFVGAFYDGCSRTRKTCRN